MKHLVTMAEERGATTTNPKMMPRQHIGTGNSIEIPMQKRSVRMCGTRKGWWGAPGNRVPTGRRHGKLGETCNDNSKTVHPRASHTTHMHSFTSVASGLYLRSVRFRGGSSRCDVEEVDVLGMVVVEVVAHGDGSGSSRTRSFQIGT